MNLDQITMGVFPLLAASQTGVLQDPEKHGVRYVAASDGMWRAIDTAWLKALTPVCCRRPKFDHLKAEVPIQN